MIIDLNLYHKKALVIGGGIEGMRKVRGLLGQSCNIIVISDCFDSYLANLANEGKIQIVKTNVNDVSILDSYKDGLFLVLACTDDKLLNQKLVKKGRLLGAFVYAADDPSFSDFSYASIINIEGVMQIAISTSGKSPIMARQVRIKAERILRRVIKKTDIENAKLQEFARNAAKSRIKLVRDRKRFLYSLINDKYIQNLIKEDRIEDAKTATIGLLEKWGEQK